MVNLANCRIQFERATWHVDRAAVPESFELASGALVQVNLMQSRLLVRPDTMLANVKKSTGLIVASAVMLALAPIARRQRAHDLA
jgi:3-carboxy-cis,cis-muconate cycloisomerase